MEWNRNISIVFSSILLNISVFSSRNNMFAYFSAFNAVYWLSAIIMDTEDDKSACI